MNLLIEDTRVDELAGVGRIGIRSTRGRLRQARAIPLGGLQGYVCPLD